MKTSLTHKENAAPVALIFFNRAEQTMRVLQAIIKAEPKVIILISDGARVNVAGEHDTVEEIRQAAISLIPKTIRTEKLFAPYNLGCAHRVSSGIDYVLRKYGEAIFLEDDCLPSPAFFPYVQQKLSEYRHVKNIGSITGSRLMHSGTSKANGVTPYPIIWGWATWLRAWDGYTLDVKDFKPEELDYLLTNKITDSRGLSEWKRLLRFAQERPNFTWDYQWQLHCIKARLLCVHPYENLISNIGFGVKATHTTEPYSRFSNLRSSARFDQDIDTTIDRIDKKYTRFLETEFFHDRLTLSGIYHRLIRKIAELNQRWPTEKIRKLSAKTANP